MWWEEEIWGYWRRDQMLREVAADRLARQVPRPTRTLRGALADALRMLATRLDDQHSRLGPPILSGHEHDH